MRSLRKHGTLIISASETSRRTYWLHQSIGLFQAAAAPARRGRRGFDGGCSSDAPGAIQGPVPTNLPVTNFGSAAPQLPSLVDDPSSAGAASNGTMRSLKLSDAEDFYFKNQKSLINSNSNSAEPHAASLQRRRPTEEVHFCRLCQEDVVAPITPRAHILASSRITHLNHTCRETVLDSLVLLLRRGYPIDRMGRVWARTLYYHPAFPRIHALVSPDAPLFARRESLLSLLQALKRMGVIDIAMAVVAPTADNRPAPSPTGSSETSSPSSPVHALSSQRRRQSMERAECIGDNSWGHHMSHRIMAVFPDRQFEYSQFSYNYNTVRDACEMNVTLTWMYDVLHISMLFEPWQRDMVSDGKMKADIVEAILGELHLNLFGFEPGIYDTQPFVEVNGVGERPLASVIQHVLTEIYDMIILHFLQELSHTALPLAKEIAAPMLWRSARNQLNRAKDRTGLLRRRNFSVSGHRSVSLPPLLGLFDVATPAPAASRSGDAHPLRNCRTVASIASIVPETLASTPAGMKDVFQHMIQWGFSQEDVSSDLKKGGVLKKDDDFAWSAMRESLRLGLSCDTTPLLDVEAEHAYFRDHTLDVAVCASPSGSKHKATAWTRQERLSFTTANAFPTLKATPELSDTTDDSDSQSAAASSVLRCPFASSDWIPTTVKPPSAGVVTDKNLFFGWFDTRPLLVTAPLTTSRLTSTQSDAATASPADVQQPSFAVTMASPTAFTAVTGTDSTAALDSWKSRWMQKNELFQKGSMLIAGMLNLSGAPLPAGTLSPSSVDNEGEDCDEVTAADPVADEQGEETPTDVG